MLTWAAISLEAESHPHLHPFLVSILQPPSIGLRSRQQENDNAPAKADPADVLPYTPLSVLTVDGLDPEQIWAQLELRNEGVCKVVKEVGAEEAADMDEDEEEDDDETDSEEGSDEEMSIEEWNKMMAEGGYEEGDSANGSEEDESELGSSDEDEDIDDTVEFEDGTKIGDSDSDLEGESGDESADEEDEDEEDDDGESDNVDEEDGESDADVDGNLDVDMDDDDGSFPAAGSSRTRKAKHPTLDDQFFSIDEFNRMTEEQEAGRVTSGALGGEEDDEPELEDFGSMFLSQNDEPAGRLQPPD